jgi:hypothetical protein
MPALPHTPRGPPRRMHPHLPLWRRVPAPRLRARQTEGLPPISPPPQPPAAHLGGRRASRGLGSLGEDELSRRRSESLVLSKAGGLDLDDDGNSIILKPGALTGAESGTSLDMLQHGD